METALALLFLSTFFIFLVCKGIRKKYNKTSRSELSFENLPTPTSLPFIGNGFHFLRPNFDVLQTVLDWVNKYGTIFKVKIFSEQVIVLAEPSMIQTLLGSYNPGHLNKYRLAYDEVFIGPSRDGIIVADYNVWKPHRNIVQRAFSYKSQLYHLMVLNQHAKDLVSELQTEYQAKPNVREKICYKMMKVILHAIMDIDIISEEDQNCYHDSFILLKTIASYKLLHPWLMFKPLWKLHPLRKSFDEALAKAEKFLEMVLFTYRTRNSGSKNKMANTPGEDGTRNLKCLMDELLDSGMSDQEIMNELETIAAAGNDTSSESLSFLLLHLALNPQIQENCRKEVDQIFDSKKFVGIDSNNLTMEDLPNLKYLERCISENLRLCPVIPGFARRLESPLQLNENLTLPAGSVVIIAPWAVHRNPEIWHEPEIFDPDRFSPENCKKRHPSAYIPFSGGSRNCVGWKMAIMTLKIMTSWILRDFIVETTDKWEDLRFQFNTTLVTKNNINLILKKRTDLKSAV